MKHSFVTSSTNQHFITTITENPLHDVSLSKKSEDYSRTRTSRAKQLFNSLRNFASAGVTPTASPNRNAGNGVVCRIPRTCCRYSSPQKQADLTSPPQLRFRKNAINSSLLSVLDITDKQALRQRTVSDGLPRNTPRIIMEKGAQLSDQLSIVSNLSGRSLWVLAKYLFELPFFSKK